jgi:ABC-type polysaccharide/polyol phosphate transport system ATPase subunit
MIRLRDVSLERRTREEFSDDFKSRAFALLAGRLERPRRKTVLENINLQIEPGEKVALIGPNGAGKSTILKLICGVLNPTAGTVDVRGRVAPLLELGAGFNPELSVVDNIVLYGVLLGLDRATINHRLEAILAFAELEEYRRYPVRALSSGMAARLGFAIATDADADVLLIDEALSVGDESFRAKSRARIDALWHAHRTVVIVSHDLGLVRAICERAVWVERGRIVADGPPGEIVDRYVRAVDAAAIDALLRARIDV